MESDTKPTAGQCIWGATRRVARRLPRRVPGSRSWWIPLILAVAAQGAGYDWPADSPSIVASFGQRSGALFGSGIGLVGSAADVRAIAAGELVFWYDPAVRPSSFPQGLGAHVVIQHAENVRSLYTHLAAGSVRSLPVVPRGTSIGRMGDSGAALGTVLGLAILDMETQSYLNPLIVMPSLEDRQPPSIARVLLRSAAGVVDLSRRSSAAPGAVEVLVEAFDLREDLAYRWRLAPYSVALAVNGKQTALVTFDSLRASASGLTVGEGRTAESIYADTWTLSLGEVQLRNGETHLAVFVRDYAGNEATREFELSVRGDGGS